jgi:sugar lactone lactonase YvrE
MPGNTTNKLNYPYSLALKQPNILYVSDTSNHRVQKFIMNTLQGSTVAGQANSTPGSASNALNNPIGIIIDDNDNLYVADAYNHRIQLWSNGSSSGRTIAGNTSKNIGILSIH